MDNTIVAISDSHRSSLSELPPSLLAALQDASLIVHAGDHTEASLLEELRRVGTVIAVAGNMDSTAIKLQLPHRQLFTFSGVTVGVTHGSGAPHGIAARVRAMFPEDPALIVFGHSHVPYNDIVEGSHMVNPGPAHAGYAVITIDREIHIELRTL
ncbi:MAG: metallophosphoesterase family protein [Dehalococcoidia bacterium]|nr:metallophosphoesterase family protein [Dehalococcoidia bacterium]